MKRLQSLSFRPHRLIGVSSIFTRFHTFSRAIPGGFARWLTEALNNA